MVRAHQSTRCAEVTAGPSSPRRQPEAWLRQPILGGEQTIPVCRAPCRDRQAICVLRSRSRNSAAAPAHPGLTTEAKDLDAEIGRLMALGARQVDIGQAARNSWTLPGRSGGKRVLRGSGQRHRSSDDLAGQPARRQPAAMRQDRMFGPRAVVHKHAPWVAARRLKPTLLPTKWTLDDRALTRAALVPLPLNKKAASRAEVEHVPAQRDGQCGDAVVLTIRPRNSVSASFVASSRMAVAAGAGLYRLGRSAEARK